MIYRWPSRDSCAFPKETRVSLGYCTCVSTGPLSSHVIVLLLQAILIRNTARNKVKVPFFCFTIPRTSACILKNASPLEHPISRGPKETHFIFPSPYFL